MDAKAAYVGQSRLKMACVHCPEPDIHYTTCNCDGSTSR